MAQPEFPDLAHFVAVATHLSFRRAALERGVSASALSHAIRDLEERLGVRLINRTTRSVALTEAGQRLFARLQPAFADIRDALEAVNNFRDRPMGTLKLNVPRSAAIFILGPMMAEFLRKYPDIHLEITINNGFVDIVADGYDAGIRFGEHIAKDMITTRIGPDMRFAVTGSPRYFETRPKPLTPHDLKDHDCIRRRFPSGVVQAWQFERDGEPLAVDVEGPLTLDDPDLMIQAALDGIGLTCVLEPWATPFLRSNRLVRVLEDWCPPFPGMFLYYPSRRQMPAALRALIDIMRSMQNF